jgi:hypothetical protein
MALLCTSQSLEQDGMGAAMEVGAAAAWLGQVTWKCMWVGQVKHKVVSEGVLAWVEEERLRGELGGSVGVLRMMLRALLVAGAKSFTHMITALERYSTALHTLLQEAGPEVGHPNHVFAAVPIHVQVQAHASHRESPHYFIGNVL